MSRITLVLTLLLAAALAAPSLAYAGSPDVVVSQVYGGGGNAGATLTNDFVELFNRGSTAVDLSGWTVQYATAAGTSWQSTPLAGTILPGRYYLVQLASSGDVGAPLPTPEASGTANLSASSGKVAVVRGSGVLTCGAAAASCASEPLVADLIGYGSAADFEGPAAAPGLSSTTAALRAGDGCTDTDANDADFATGAPAPRNSATAARVCGGDEPPPPPPAAASAEASAGVDVEIQPVLTVSLEKPTLDFGRLAWLASPAPISEPVTVVSNDPDGYVFGVHRSAFVPDDLPLAIAAAAPSGGQQLGTALAGGSLVPIPVAPAADLTIGTSATTSADGGDVWPTSIGFATPIPLARPGHYTATLTFTVVGR